MRFWKSMNWFPLRGFKYKEWGKTAWRNLIQPKVDQPEF